MRTIIISLLLVASLAVGGPAAAGSRPASVDIDAFMAGLSCTESGGRYDAVNAVTGAIGKYQIMPANWRAWTKRYMGNPWAQPTPRNQEFIARERIIDLYAKHGDWSLVAHWWLTGNAPLDPTTWSDSATHYVQTVMAIAVMAAGPDADELVPPRCFPKEYSEPRIRDWPLPRVVVTGGRVNVRVAPGYENRAIDTVRQGTRLSVLAKGVDARGNKWLKVGLGGNGTGWIAAWYTEPAD